MRRFFETVTKPEVVQVCRFDLHRFFADGDDVVVSGRFDYHYPSSGRDFEGDFAVRFTVRGDKVALYRIFEDSEESRLPIRGAAPRPCSVHRGTLPSLVTVTATDRSDGMNALVNAPSSSEKVRFVRVDEPVARPNEALVAVEAFSLNRGELRQLEHRPEG